MMLHTFFLNVPTKLMCRASRGNKLTARHHDVTKDEFVTRAHESWS